MATSAQQKAFIGDIAPIIQKYAREYGYKVASAIIAQACIESAYGTSSLGYKYHNYFGMKCGKNWKGKSVNLSTKEEYKAGTLTSIKANFRVYDSMEEGVRGYFEFISGSRYQNLKQARTPEEYLILIKQDGYATSSIYVNTNMNVVNKYSLAKYDNFEKGEPDVKLNEITMKLPTIRRGSTGSAVRIWQVIVGADPDGIFGNDTEKRTLIFQNIRGLKEDAIVGSQTWTNGFDYLK